MLNSVSYTLLAPIAILMALAPFVPAPHLYEKIVMLMNGDLKKPIDIFDLLLHAAPLAFLLAKLANDFLLKSD